MLVEKDIKRILDQLGEKAAIKIAIDGSDIDIHVLEGATKLFLTTPVYSGGNYIPSSVRRCVSHKTPFPVSNSSLQTFLTIDEQHFQINLNYLGRAQPLAPIQLKEILEEFGWLAEKWRDYLDENDKNDLVYIRVPR